MELKEKKVKTVKKLDYKDDVYDINVADVHHYILENGMVTHNTMDLFPQDKMKGGEGLFYSASTIAFLSKAKLTQGEQDDLDLNQSGILATAKLTKNRLARPKKIKFEISFVEGCNPYSGLDYWCTAENFEQIGIGKGKMDGDTFVPGGNRWYVRHLGTHIKKSDLLTAKVFTQEVLEAMRPILKEYFKYKSFTEINEIQKRLEEAKGDYEEAGLEEFDSASLFDDDED